MFAIRVFLLEKEMELNQQKETNKRLSLAMSWIVMTERISLSTAELSLLTAALHTEETSPTRTA